MLGYTRVEIRQMREPGLDWVKNNKNGDSNFKGYEKEIFVDRDYAGIRSGGL